MTPLPKTQKDDLAKLVRRIELRRSARKGARDLERRLIIARCRQIRQEVRAERGR